jgi:membrane dipeptidase
VSVVGGQAERARRLHRDAVVIDGHCDILMPAVEGVTTLETPWSTAEKERWRLALGDGLDLAWKTAPAGQYELPLLEQGGLTAQCAAIYIRDEFLDSALERALEMAVVLSRHVEANQDRCVLARCAGDIDHAKGEGKVAYVLTMEGAEPIGRRPALLDVFAQLGLRMTTLTHDRRNWLADGTNYPDGTHTGGLTKLGKEAVRRCDELGIVLDLTHLSDRSFWDVVETSRGPVVCSHAHQRTAAPYATPWDEVSPTYGVTKAQAIARKGGLIGVMFFNQADIDDVLADVEAWIAQIGPQHIGLGSDFFGFDLAPRDLQHMGELPRLTEALVGRGHDDEAILGILGRNWLRVFDEVWRAS